MKHFPKRRYSQDRQNMRLTAVMIVAIITLLVLFIVGGIPALSSMGSFISGMKKDATVIQPDDAVVLEPILDPPVTATNTGTIAITGTGTTGSTVLLYVNGSKQEEILVGREGTFTFPRARLKNGNNEIYTITKLNNSQSQPSKSFTVSYLNQPPKLEITKPEDKYTTKDQELIIEGSTDKDVEVTINDRFVYTDPNGNFTITFSLSKGENTVNFKATDIAGNTAQKELKIIYED